MNKKVIEILAGALKLKVEDLTQVLASETEVDFKIPETIKIFTDSELETIKDNHGKDKYDEGKTASREMLLKEMSKDAGFESTVKDAKEFVKTYKANILKDATIEPNEKIADLESSINTLQESLRGKDADYSALEEKVKTRATRGEAYKLIPELAKEMGLSRDEATSLFFMKHEIREDGIYKDGVKLKDKLENSLSLTDAVKGYVSDKGWDKDPAATGSGFKKPTDKAASSLDEYEAIIKEKGLNPGSMEANALLREMATKNPEILN